MSEPSPAQPLSSWLRPSRPRLLAAVLLAAGAFILPQSVPLEWYPLNHPGPGLNYLEITCAADVHGEMRIDYDLARDGHRPIDTIRVPVSPTQQAYTYTFPLPDAPITEVHVAPPKNGSLTIRQMRIINRRGEEIRRFPRDLFQVQRGVTEIAPLPDGLKLVATPGAPDPSTRIELFVPIIPEGMNHRNLLRCLLSTGYLALMLMILLLAVLFVFHRPRSWRDFLAHAGFLAALALCFSAVGNRGLIRNSICYARYVPPVPSPGLSLELDVASTFRFPAQLFWDTGAGMSESTSTRATYEPHDGLQTLRFALPATPVKALRLDPGDSAGTWTVRGLRLVDHGQRTRLNLPLDALVPIREIAHLEAGPDELHLVTTDGAKDPITEFKPAVVTAISGQLTVPSQP